MENMIELPLVELAKLTPAQRLIYQRLRKGDRVLELNLHYANGGRWEWESDRAVIRCRPFWRLLDALYGNNYIDKGIHARIFFVPREK